MKTKNKLFTDREIDALKIVRGILNRAENKYDRWVDKNSSLDGEAFNKDEAKLDAWLDQLLNEGGIDFSFDGKAFIKTKKQKD